MKSVVPVAAVHLHRRQVRWRDATLAAASLFPYFDSEGEVKSLMLVWPASPSILMMELEPGLVRVPWWGPVEVDAELAAQRDADADRAAVLGGGLWHYDPWWVLKAPRYAGHSAVPVLKATNCADRFPVAVAGVFFARDLSRLVGFARKGAGFVRMNESVMGFESRLLPEEPEPTAGPSPAGWRLDPFWQRSGWGRR